eukprot:scaffold78842_cov19-Tisochrysis_lutea.AAC.2
MEQNWALDEHRPGFWDSRVSGKCQVKNTRDRRGTQLRSGQSMHATFCTCCCCVGCAGIPSRICIDCSGRLSLTLASGRVSRKSGLLEGRFESRVVRPKLACLSESLPWAQQAGSLTKWRCAAQTWLHGRAAGVQM